MKDVDFCALECQLSRVTHLVLYD